MFYILFLIIVSSKKIIEINQYKLYSSSYSSSYCASFSDKIEQYDIKTCYMDTLLHDNYGLSIQFEYCSIKDDKVKMLMYNNKKCSTNKNIVIKYLNSGYYKINGNCYKFKCVDVKEDQDDDIYETLIGIFVFIIIILFIIHLSIKKYKYNNIINNIQSPQHIMIHNPNLENYRIPYENIEMNAQEESIEGN